MRFRRLLSLTVLGGIVAGAAITTTAVPASVASAASATSAFVAMPTAQRLVDTRLATALPAGGSLSVSVTGTAPLPAPGTVVAAVLNLTVTGPAGTGYWTVWPHTSPRPEASNLNVDETAVARPERDPEPRDRPGRC